MKETKDCIDGCVKDGNLMCVNTLLINEIITTADISESQITTLIDEQLKKSELPADHKEWNEKHVLVDKMGKSSSD